MRAVVGTAALLAAVACKSPGDAALVPATPDVGKRDAAPPVVLAPGDDLDRRALLVGIADYRYDAEGIPDLRGPRYDLENMRTLLTQQFAFPAEKVKVLRDAEASRDGILQAFREHLIAPATAKSVVVFYYSGHGSQMTDEDGGDEQTDHLDETLVAQDSGRVRHENRDITDDELNALLVELEAKTEVITVILDSCHSGSGLRGNGIPRRVDADRRPRARARGLAEGPGNRPAAAKYALLTGSRDDEVSNEGYIDGAVQGAFTWALSDVIRQRGANATYRDVMEEVRERVGRRYALQHPQLEGAGMDRLVFGAGSRPAEKYHLVKKAGEQYEVDGGAVHGLVVGSELEVFPPGTAQIGKPGSGVARLSVQEVGAVRSLARCVETCAFEDQSRAVERTRPAIGGAVAVWVDPKLAMAKTLSQRLGEYPMVTLTADPSQYDLRVSALEGKVRVEDRTGFAGSEGVKPAAAGAGDLVLEQVLRWAKWISVGQIKNESSDLKLAVTVGGTSTARPEDVARGKVFRDGDTVVLGIQNDSDRSVYLNVLAIGSDGEVAVLYPAPGSQEAMAPHQSLEKRITASWSADWKQPELRNQVKVIAATKPTDLRFLAQPPFRGGDQGAGKEVEAFAAVLKTALGSRGGLVVSGVPTVATDTWVTADVTVVTVPK